MAEVNFVSTNKSFFSILQKVGQSLMVPVSVLPAAGLLVALARYMQGFATDAAGVVTHPLLNAVAKVLFTGGLAIFEQLPVVFAVGVAIGFTGGAGVAGLSAVVGYFTLANVLKVVGELRELPLKIDTGVFGGILIGLLSASLYKRYFQTKLHPVFGFFSGKRLVPIVTAASSVFVAVLLAFLWPPVQSAIRNFGVFVMGSSIGPAFYAAGKRLLIPVGLHHVYYPSFLYEFGEFVTKTGEVLRGDATRYFGGDPTAGRFMASEFPIMLFGLPAAALAMTLRARPERRKMVAGVMLSAALTSIITGITEPIEFAFIFVAPILFVFHVLAAFCSGLLTNVFDIHQGYTFSASLIDWAVGYFNQKNSMQLFLIVGPLVACVYFGVFYTAIGWLNLKTPGRDEVCQDECSALSYCSSVMSYCINWSWVCWILLCTKST
jgi:phosphotransferase system  glucose/maltose/N-acetylglucosamine-specific IIC component